MQIRAFRLFACAAAALISSSGYAQDNIYFGNLHAHTVYSDGSGTPDEAYKAARDAGLDFMAISEHSHKAAEGSGDSRQIHIARDSSLYNGSQSRSLTSAATRRTIAGKFVAIYGQEYSTISGGNHVNVFDVPEVIDIPNKEFRELIEWTKLHPDSSGRPALMQFNHPALRSEDELEYGRDDFGSDQAWIEAMDAQIELIEVFNGPATAKTGGFRSAAVQETDYYHYLNLGFHLAPSVGQDNHYRTWGVVTEARVTVIAPELTKEAVLGALRARHAYATADKNLRLVYRSGSALQGDVVNALPAADVDLPLSLTIKDDDEPTARYRVDVFSDVPGGEPIRSDKPTNSFILDGDITVPIHLDGVPFVERGQYVVVRVTQLSSDGDDETANEDVAWTAPIWFEDATAAVPADNFLSNLAVSAVRLTRLLPNPSGPDLRFEKIWLRNLTSEIISLEGWTVTNISGNAWRLSGFLAAGEERDYTRNREPMSLNNDGDTLELRNSSGASVQTVTYGPANRNEEVPVP